MKIGKATFNFFGRVVLTIWLCSFFQWNGFAQDMVFHQIPESRPVVNPAFMGSVTHCGLGLYQQNQWSNVDDIYFVNGIWYSVRLNEGKKIPGVGFSGWVERDENKLSQLNKTKAGLGVMFRFKIDDKTFLRFGLRPVYTNFHVSADNLVFEDQLNLFGEDGSTNESFERRSINKISLSTGAAFIWKKTNWIGLSLRDIRRNLSIRSFLHDYSRAQAGDFYNNSDYILWSFHGHLDLFNPEDKRERFTGKRKARGRRGTRSATRPSERPRHMWPSVAAEWTGQGGSRVVRGNLYWNILFGHKKLFLSKCKMFEQSPPNSGKVQLGLAASSISYQNFSTNVYSYGFSLGYQPRVYGMRGSLVWMRSRSGEIRLGNTIEFQLVMQMKCRKNCIKPSNSSYFNQNGF